MSLTPRKSQLSRNRFKCPRCREPIDPKVRRRDRGRIGPAM